MAEFILANAMFAVANEGLLYVLGILSIRCLYTELFMMESEFE